MTVLVQHVPYFIIAGDTHQFQLTYPDYPASQGYTGLFMLNGIGGGRTITATPVGDDYLFTMTDAQTTLQAGTYSWAVKVRLNGSTTTVDQSYLEVKDQIDGLSQKLIHAETMVSQIETALQLITRGEPAANYNIAGRSVSLYKLEELRDLRAYYLRELDALRNGRVAASIKPIFFNTWRFF